MRVEGRIFEGVAAFAFLMAIVYGVWSHFSSGYGVEPAGLIGLILTGGLCFIAGTYFRFVARRIEPRPEDEPEAEVSDGAGELGFFSPGSYWPVALATAAAVGAIALAFWMIWLLVVGFVLLMIAVGGLLFEYHSGPSHS
ncbi:MAG: cytochrome c oxidase subunit 4 [Sciscionella sp.]